MNLLRMSSLSCALQAQAVSTYRAFRRHGVPALTAYQQAMVSVRFYALIESSLRRATV